MSTQAARRIRASGLGKIPTTSVRRLTSRLSRSSGLVDQILRQSACGKSAKAVRSALASRSSWALQDGVPTDLSIIVLAGQGISTETYEQVVRQMLDHQHKIERVTVGEPPSHRRRQVPLLG